jgi:hypothetical protein
VKGTSESATANEEFGSFSIENIPMNDTSNNRVTGTCAWRASCSLLDMAPTAANIDEYRKNPPRKYTRNTMPVARETSGTSNRLKSSVPPRRAATRAR